MESERVATDAGPVGKRTFGLLQNVTLETRWTRSRWWCRACDHRRENQGTHDVVYVATENNTVYAIDVHTGTVLLNPNFGTPVSIRSDAATTGRMWGINSTPVIDPSSKTLYVMVYTQDSS